MMPLNTKTCLALLWGISVLFSTESMSTPVPEDSKNNSTAGPNMAGEPHITVVHTTTEAKPVTWHPTPKTAEVDVAAKADTTVPPTVEKEERNVTSSSDSSKYSTTGLVATNIGAATASTSGPRLIHTSTAVTTVAGQPERSHNTTNSEMPATTEDHLQQQSPNTSSVMTSSSATTSTAPLATETASSPHPTPTTEPEVPSNSSSTTSPAGSTQTPDIIHDLSSPSATTTSTITTNSTSQAPVFVPTSSSPVTISESSSTSAELSPTSQPASTMRTPSTPVFTTTTGSSSPSEPPSISFSTVSANVSTTANISTMANVSTTASVSTTANVSTMANVSTSPPGIFIPNVSNMPIPTTKSTPATTTASSSAPTTEVQPCSKWGVAKQCLIAIASLAGLATTFMVCTIVLCVKLSARKYKVRKPQPATEMMCISALLPERDYTHNYTYRRQRNPVSNGVLVIHGGGDSDDDGGDNLTLSSFLPENDRGV